MLEAGILEGSSQCIPFRGSCTPSLLPQPFIHKTAYPSLHFRVLPGLSIQILQNPNMYNDVRTTDTVSWVPC